MTNNPLLIIKIALPFLVNIPLFFLVFSSQTGHEFALTNTLFYQGIINIVYGIVVLFLLSRPSSRFHQGKYQSIMRATILMEDQEPKHNNHASVMDGPLSTRMANRLRLIYIFIGIILFIAAIISL